VVAELGERIRSVVDGEHELVLRFIVHQIVNVPVVGLEKENKTIDASGYFFPRCGSQFEGYPLPST
jgi:hypothetical protein